MNQHIAPTNVASSPDLLKLFSVFLVALSPSPRLVSRSSRNVGFHDGAMMKLRGGFRCWRGGSENASESVIVEALDCSKAPTDQAHQWCDHARSLVLNNSIAEINDLRNRLQASALNPRGDFSESVDRIFHEGMRAYDQSTKAWEGSLAYKCERGALERSLTAELLRLTRLQLSIVRDDALSNFGLELVMIMSESAHYKRAARRLIKKAAANHEKTARSNIPNVLARYADTLLERKASSLHSAMVAEAYLHEEEAIELPPREQDVGPGSWRKQLLVQVLNMALNVGQAYLLQHLPAKYRDRRDEREMPRGPLF